VAEVLIPVLNVNDEQYVLTEWLVQDGAHVQAGDVVAVVETSKAANELVCDYSGVLHRLVAAMTSCRPGQPVARIVSSASPAQHGGKPEVAEPAVTASPPGIVITNAARKLIREHGVSTAQIAAAGKKLIRAADIEAIVRQAPATGETSTRLPQHQLAVARTVSRSHASIPSAFLAIKVEASWVPVRQGGGQPTVVLPGLAELVISAVAAAAGAFPVMFACVAADLSLSFAESVDVGVTIDLGRGLNVPAIRSADKKSLSDIASALMALRVRAMRGTLTNEEMGEPRVVVALQQEAGVVLSIPIVYPGNVCAISIGALAWEAALGPSGEFVPRASFHLGISYDHRVVNGRDVALFMSAVRDHLTRIAAEAGGP
jgi:2-oxoglutarate dehydrogenase E2 component (dihydrolipoamide succinyltransferase)